MADAGAAPRSGPTADAGAAGTPAPPLAFEHSPAEAELVERLRSRFAALFRAHRLSAPPGLLEGQRLLRYARFIEEPAAEVERMLRLRAALGMDAIHEAVSRGAEWPAERQMAGVWQHSLFGCAGLADREGRPLFLAAIGGLSRTRQLFAAVEAESVRAHLLHCLEALNRGALRLSEARGRLLSWAYVLDLSGFSLWQAAGSEASRSFFARLGEEVNRLAAPCLIGRVLLVHAPAQWQLVWRAAVRIMPPRVQAKVLMLGSPAELSAYVHPSMLPVRYGGRLADEAVFAARAPLGGCAGGSEGGRGAAPAVGDG